MNRLEAIRGRLEAVEKLKQAQETIQKLQARIAQLEKALRELLNHSRGGGQDIVRTMARREAIRDAEAALTADPSPVVEVVRAARDVKNAFEADLRGDDWWNTIIALRDAVDNLDEQQPGVWNK